MFEITGTNSIMIENNLFEGIVASSKGLITTNNAEVVTISKLEMTNVTHISLLSADPLLKISTQEMGKCILEYLEFYENNIKSNSIAIYYSVGSLVFRHNVFHDEVIAAFNNYIRLENLYELNMQNSTFKDMVTDKSNDRITLLFNIMAVNLSIDGSFEINTLTMSNISMSLLSLDSIRGSTPTNKTITIENILFKDATFPTRNNFMTFGPFITTENLIIKLRNLEFKDLDFENTANIIEVSMQGPIPVSIDSCTFDNIVGGNINIKPTSIAEGTTPASLEMTNVTVKDCDFKYQTLFVLRNFCQLTVTNCTMRRNSAYFRGTIVSILGSDSSANFRQCNFNNNNGILGGLFYVNRLSYIQVQNSTLFSNFAVVASLAYVANQGQIIIDG
jgi:uncharacterized protein YjbI with pentapeptide repeats